MNRHMLFRKVALFGLALLVGCGGRGSGGGGAGRGNGSSGDTCDPDTPDCAEGLVCDAVLDGDARCVGPVVIRGTVLDIADDNAIEGALVQAVDINGAAVGTWAATDENGDFTLFVPAVRDADDNPVEGIYTLRVQASGYQEFPTAIRPALPLDASTAESDEDGWVIENGL